MPALLTHLWKNFSLFKSIMTKLEKGAISLLCPSLIPSALSWVCIFCCFAVKSDKHHNAVIRREFPANFWHFFGIFFQPCLLNDGLKCIYIFFIFFMHWFWFFFSPEFVVHQLVGKAIFISNLHYEKNYTKSIRPTDIYHIFPKF